MKKGAGLMEVGGGGLLQSPRRYRLMGVGGQKVKDCLWPPH